MYESPVPKAPPPHGGEGRAAGTGDWRCPVPRRGLELDCIELHCIELHSTMHCMHCIASDCIALHCIAVDCIALHCSAFDCIALHCHCIALRCIAVHCRPTTTTTGEDVEPVPSSPPHPQGRAGGQSPSAPPLEGRRVRVSGDWGLIHTRASLGSYSSPW